MRRKRKPTRNTKIAGKRDMKILLFLWKWKMATTHTLATRYFYDVSPATAYRRLYRLAEGGFITSRCDVSGNKFIWILEQKGFDVVRRYLPATLQEEGFKSEHAGHDLVASAFHLGGFLKNVPEQVELFSEQQLRRYRPKDYPFFVCPGIEHRPDGYTCVRGDDTYKVFAFEVELNVKVKRRYNTHYWTYGKEGREAHEIDSVLWLTASKKEAARLKKIVLNYSASDSIVKHHSFYTLSDFLKYGWDAKEVLGEYGSKSVKEKVSTLLTNKVVTESNHVCSQVLLNTSKTLHRSKTYRMYEFGDFC